jgi:hypothetical protein
MKITRARMVPKSQAKVAGVLAGVLTGVAIGMTMITWSVQLFSTQKNMVRVHTP